MSSSLADVFVGASAETFTSPVKILVGPISKEFIKMIAKGCLSCNATHAAPVFCEDQFKNKEGDKVKMCILGDDWTQKYQEDGRVIKAGRAAGEDGAEDNQFVRITRKVLRFNGCVS